MKLFALVSEIYFFRSLTLHRLKAPSICRADSILLIFINLRSGNYKFISVVEFCLECLKIFTSSFHFSGQPDVISYYPRKFLNDNNVCVSNSHCSRAEMSTLSPSNLPWSAPRFRFLAWTFLLQRPAKSKKPLLTRRTSLYHVSNYHWSTSNSFTVHKCMAMATYRACVARVSVGLVNKERPRNEIFGVFHA